MVKGSEYISFDIFDTLIKRNVARPTDLFCLMEEYCKKQQRAIPEHFAEKRIQAERSASKKAGASLTLDDIYQQLMLDNPGMDPTLEELEIRFELDSCRPYTKYVDLLRRYVKAGKAVILISDMYLPRSVIEEMLSRCGVQGYQKLYLSCEMGASKAQGNLYHLVLKDLGIPAKNLTHIGDNRKSDGICAAALGIRTSHVEPLGKNLAVRLPALFPKDTLCARSLQACVENAQQKMSACTALGCAVLGPVLLGFAQWLAEELQKERISDVFFMARDGYSMMKVFESLQVKDVRTHYLYCSRRAFTVPLICRHPELDEIFENITLQERISLRVFLLRLGLDPERYKEKARQFGLSVDQVFEHNALKFSPEVRKLYEAIRPDVIENSTNEFEAFARYIQQSGISHGKIAVVDIGWHGTMQNALQQLLQELNMDVQVKGYYMGVIPDSELASSGKIEACGYLYQKGKNEAYREILGRFISIFESSFLAPHGSAEKFVLRNHQAEVQLYDYEYDVQDGKKIDEVCFMQQFQSGAFILAEDLGRSLLMQSIQIDPEVAIMPFVRMGTKPSLSEANMWGDFRVFDTEMLMIAAPQPFSVYFRNPQMLKKDLLLCPWKIGFLKRLLKIPFPYNRLYQFLKKQFHRRKGE